LKNLIGRIAKDEERHEEFFANLVAHCLTTQRDETIAAIAGRAAAFEPVGADIDAYRDKVRVVADAGIFDDAALRKVLADRIADWGVADAPALAEFVSQ
jgi:acyl-[acyl-carrier-protein] desaturase